MRRETLGGWAMIAGAVMGLVTMGFHPTGGGHAARALAVHALAITAAPIAFYADEPSRGVCPRLTAATGA